MWDRLEQSFNGLSPEDKKWLAEDKNAEPFGKEVRFHGFDGNNESPYISAASFLIGQLGQFQNFKDRDLSAHVPTLEAHRRMLAVFDPILKRVSNLDFGAAEIAEVVAAQKYPH